jgi:hypothetical protein
LQAFVGEVVMALVEQSDGRHLVGHGDERAANVGEAKDRFQEIPVILSLDAATRERITAAWCRSPPYQLDGSRRGNRRALSATGTGRLGAVSSRHFGWIG